MKKITLILCSLFSSYLLLAQSRQLNGTVTDPSGQGVISATVKVKGSNAATNTNADGKFSLTVPAGNHILEISSVGFGTSEVKISDSQTSIDIPLSVSNQTLSEVVVTAL
ncbi:MAG: carboxypeptidase-like regulatory domain-containing protein, partial [Ginsengibacter sp.]